MNGTPVASCAGTFYDSGGSNGNYSNNQNLSTTICPNNGKYLRLSFPDIQLAPGDELCFHDGSSILTPMLACSGDFPPGQPFFIQASTNNPGGCLTLGFLSDAAGTAPGWGATISCEDPCFVLAPANLTVVAIANGNIVWAWDAVPLSPGYEVSINGGAWIPANGNLSHTVSGLAPGDLVIFEVRALSGMPGCLPVSTSASKTYLNCTLEAGVDALAPATCPGTATGSAYIIVNNPTGPVQYFADNNPNPFSSGDFVDFFPAGDHFVIVQDASGCRDTILFNISEPPPLVALIDSVSNARCFGGDDGLIRAIGSGGTPPYAYTWQSCQGGPLTPGRLLKDIFAGCYSVTVTDNNGCTSVTQDSVRQGVKYKFTTSQDSVLCFGTMTGRATVIASGAKPPYIFLWDNGDKTPTADSLKAGTHAVTVTDAVGCIAVTLVEVKEPKRLVIDSIQVVHLSCFGGTNGSATVFPNGGVLSYAFTWTGAKTGQMITGLSAGPYSVTVTDHHGCTVSSSTLINQPPELLAPIADLKPETCSGACNGSITLSPSGGVSPYGIVWDKPNIPPGTFAPANLCPGTYQATVTDVNGCSKTVQAAVQQAAPIIIQLTSQAPRCTGDQNGNITATVSGGTMPYQYLWNTGSTAGAIQNLSCGAYTVTVTDSLLCTALVSDTLPCPMPTVLDSIVPKRVRCFGEANGEVSVYVRGGGGTLTYLWSDPNQQFDFRAVNLLQGTYTVTVSDPNGCSLTASAIVTQPPVLSATISTTNVTCFGGNNGTAKATVNGGVMPYTFNWSFGPDSSAVSGLVAGTYPLTVTDQSGCTFSGPSAIIAQPATPTLITINQTKLACFGSGNGEALATASGNNGGPFTYKWSHGFNGPAPTDLASGTYTVTVTDQKLCTGTQSVTIVQWNAIEVGLLRAEPTCHNGTDAQVAVNQISGGAGNGDFSKYHYTWSIPGKPDTLYINGLTGGAAYSLTVTDESGCSTTVAFTMLNQAPIVPTLSVDSVRCNGSADGAVRITGVQSPYPVNNYTWSNSGGGPEQINLVANVYTVTLTDTKGCTGTAEATVGEPPLLAVNLEVNALVCNNDSNGLIRAIVQGGVPGYTYAWNTGSPAPQINGLGPGDYRVSVTDQHGCVVIDSTILIQPNAPEIKVETIDPTCFGAHDGLFHLIVTGNAPPYRYSFDGVSFGGSAAFLGLGEGQYTAYVRDGMGCITAVSATLTQPPPVEVSFGPDTSIILGDSIQLTPDIFNAVGLVSYTWRSTLVDSFYCVDIPDCATIQAQPGYSNTYFVTITDANGCRGSGSTQVEVVKPRGVYVPTGFSPNGDNTNDLLVVFGKSRQIKQVKVFRVFDRWGELVYEDYSFPINDEQRGWNGQVRGKDAQTGVYSWYVEAEYRDGFVEALRGNTTLIR